MMGWKPDVTLLLSTPPQECFQRMNKRGRDCEATLSLDYIINVAEEYRRVYHDKPFLSLDYHGMVSDVADRTIDLIFSKDDKFQKEKHVLLNV
jgi:thymidylate kinase